jgi:hypothetical protein
MAGSPAPAVVRRVVGCPAAMYVFRPMAQIVNVLNLRCQYPDVISLQTIPAQAIAP